MSELPFGASIYGFPPADVPELLSKFLHFWQTKRQGRLVPDFEDLDPLEMPWALRTIFVVERHDDRRLTYRLVGGDMSTRLGGGLVGKSA
jgi:hypothetical protein